MRFLFLAALLVISSACGSARAPVAPRPVPEVRAPAPPRALPPPPAAAPRTVGERAVAVARTLLATPYHYGGTDRQGFDCSGLVRYVLRSVGLELPRTAREQAAAGRWVPPDELRPGDLVFFGDDRDKPYHVGLVVDSSGRSLKMIHAATSKGVVETDVLRSPYWLDRFRFARRVLP